VTYQLFMVRSTISDPDRLRVLVTSQMIKCLLLKIFTTVNGVYAERSVPDYQVKDQHTSAMTHPNSIDQQNNRVFERLTYPVLQSCEDEIDICICPVH
jgi:hypothetical protein